MWKIIGLIEVDIEDRGLDRCCVLRCGLKTWVDIEVENRGIG